MTRAEAVNIVREIKERLSLLKDYVACKNEFESLKRQMLEIGEEDSRMGTIAQIVAEEFNVPVEAMRGYGREEIFLAPRGLAILLTYKSPGNKISLVSIGKWYGGRHHATIEHAIRATENRLAVNSYGIRERYARIEKKLQAL